MSAKKANDIGIFMVAVGAVIEHPESGTILLTKRASDNFQPGVWEIGYGRLDQGEDPEVGLLREIKEETGQKNIKIIELLTAWHFYRGEAKPENEVIGMTYWCQTSDQNVVISREHDEYRWVTPEEALELVSVDGIKNDIEAYLLAKENRSSLALAKEKEQRAIADYQNLVRRTREEKASFAKFAAQDLIEDLLEPLEHLSTASNQLNDQGLNMIKDLLWQRLSQHGLEEINPLGQKFNLETMEVVEKQGDGDLVVSVVRRGYRLHDRVIQHAKVVLGKAD